MYTLCAVGDSLPRGSTPVFVTPTGSGNGNLNGNANTGTGNGNVNGNNNGQAATTGTTTTTGLLVQPSSAKDALDISCARLKLCGIESATEKSAKGI